MVAKELKKLAELNELDAIRVFFESEVVATSELVNELRENLKDGRFKPVLIYDKRWNFFGSPEKGRISIYIEPKTGALLELLRDKTIKGEAYGVSVYDRGEVLVFAGHRRIEFRVCGKAQFKEEMYKSYIYISSTQYPNGWNHYVDIYNKDKNSMPSLIIRGTIIYLEEE